MNRHARFLIAAFACTAPSAVLAQFQSQALSQPEQVEDVLTFSAGVDVKRDDNIFRLDSGVDPTATYGKSSRSDTVVSGQFGVKFDRDISLQRVTVSGEVSGAGGAAATGGGDANPESPIAGKANVETLIIHSLARRHASRCRPAGRRAMQSSGRERSTVSRPNAALIASSRLLAELYTGRCVPAKRVADDC